MKQILKLQKISDKEFKSEDGEIVTLPGQNIPEPVFNKINELVDAVNEFHKILHDVIKESVENMSRVDALGNTVLELRAKVNSINNKPTENPTISKTENVDPYAEQRKWIGKMCQFWDYAYEHDYFDTLKGITDDGLFIGHNGSWKHCKPIKSDDPIIYKGE